MKQKKQPAKAVGMHPGTTKTELGEDYWKSRPKDYSRELEEAVEHVLSVVEKSEESQRGRVRDWAGEEVIW